MYSCESSVPLLTHESWNFFTFLKRPSITWPLCPSPVFPIASSFVPPPLFCTTSSFFCTSSSATANPNWKPPSCTIQVSLPGSLPLTPDFSDVSPYTLSILDLLFLSCVPTATYPVAGEANLQYKQIFFQLDSKPSEIEAWVYLVHCCGASA